MPEAIRKSLAKEKIMIVDPGSTSRAAMFKAFTDLGANPGNINLIDSFQNAMAETSFFNTRVVVAEYSLGKQCGLELLQQLRARNPRETKNILFVIVASNTSQKAVAEAAEEDVDAYILKPFTAELVRKVISQAILKKLEPSKYLQTIEEGKNFLEDKHFPEAEEMFRKAIALDPTPTLALYYHGYAQAVRQAMDAAKSDYERGLSYNNIHFKCLAGLFDALMHEKSYKEAYDVVRRLARFFPANPKRLVDVLKLGIINHAYDDIEEYYAMFMGIEERDDVLIRHVCAALITCGRHYLAVGQNDRALEVFQKASATGTGRVNFLKEIVQTLLDHRLPAEAQGFLKKFPPEAMNTEAYEVLEFQLSDQLNSATIYTLIGKGRELLARKIASKAIYEILLRRGVEAQMKHLVEHLYYSAIKDFPDSKAEFERLIEPVMRESA
jgi:CheY-like chemotaxis protein